MSLSAFLNPIKEDNQKFAASNRFVEEGKAVEWEIKCISSDEDEAVRKECTRKVQVPGKIGQYTNELDSDKYMGKFAAKCTVFPNLNDAELQNRYDAMGADDLLKKMLKPGEYMAYISKVQEVNGYTSMANTVEEAKN